MPALGGVFAETRHPFADREVHYYGQVVALVVGETIEQARDAAALIKVTYVAQPRNPPSRTPSRTQRTRLPSPGYRSGK
ncbi:hypothetical protein ACFQYP_34680 [Nonomuraea antimicrobica]